jgi:hypothetical protein
MSILTTILKAIGIGTAPAADVKKTTTPTKGTGKQPDISKYTEVKHAMPTVDVTAKLDAMAKAKNLDPKNWRVSIVELLNLLGIDSSHANRVELAKELGISDDLMGGDSAAMNIWLHKQVMNKIAQNGGIVPKELMD